MNKNGGPAFPTITCDEASISRGASYVQDEGMSLRDWFAGQAIVSILNRVTDRDLKQPPNQLAGQASRSAYVIADAMLEARNQ